MAKKPRSLEDLMKQMEKPKPKPKPQPKQPPEVEVIMQACLIKLNDGEGATALEFFINEFLQIKPRRKPGESFVPAKKMKELAFNSNARKATALLLKGILQQLKSTEKTKASAKVDDTSTDEEEPPKPNKKPRKRGEGKKDGGKPKGKPTPLDEFRKQVKEAANPAFRSLFVDSLVKSGTVSAATIQAAMNDEVCVKIMGTSFDWTTLLETAKSLSSAKEEAEDSTAPTNGTEPQDDTSARTIDI